MIQKDVSDDYPAYLNQETNSLATSNSSLRRSKSLSSLQDNNSKLRLNSDKAQYYEELVNTKGTSKIISHFVKRVSLQPLTQLVKPTRSNSKHSQQQLSPPPFGTRFASSSSDI